MTSPALAAGAGVISRRYFPRLSFDNPSRAFLFLART